MKAIMDWIRDHRSSTHALAAAIGTLAILVQTDERFRDLLLKDLGIHPKIISSLACLGIILLVYKQPKKIEPPPSEPPKTAPPSPQDAPGRAAGPRVGP